MSLNRNIIEREIKISAEKAKLKELEERAYIQREAVLNGERHFRQLQTLQSGIEDNLNWTIINVRSEIDNLETAQGMLIEDGIKIFKGREAKEAVLQQEIIRLKGELTKATGAMLMSGESLSPEKTGEHEKEIRDLEMRLDEMKANKETDYKVFVLQKKRADTELKNRRKFLAGKMSDMKAMKSTNWMTLERNKSEMAKDKSILEYLEKELAETKAKIKTLHEEKTELEKGEGSGLN